MKQMLKNFFLLLFLSFIAAGSLYASGDDNIIEKDGVSYELYFVKAGDTLGSISKEKRASSGEWRYIWDENRYIKNPHLIFPGQPLLISVESIKAAKERASAFSRVESVAIIKFTNRLPGENYNWIALGLAETLSTDVSKIGGLKVIERENVEGLLAEKQLADFSITEGSGAQSFGQELKTSHLIGGSYQVIGEVIDIEASLYDVSSDKVVEKASVSGKLERLFELERMLALKLLGDSVNIPDDVRADILSGEKTSIEALKQVSKGKSLFYMGNSKEAKEYYQKALETDPEYKLALQELKDSVSSADTMAIMTLKNATGREDLEWLSLGIAESLSTDIKKLTGILLVERAQVEKALEELKLGTMGGIVDEKTAPELGKMIGAGIILLGSYQTINGNIRIDIRMVDVVSSQILLSEMVTGDLENIFAVETQLAERVAAALHVELTAEEKEKLMAEKPDIESFKRYIMSQGTVEVIDRPKAEGTSQIRAIAITDFDNASNNPEYDWMSKGIPGSLSTELKTHSKLNLIERTQIEKALEELKLGQTGLVSDENAPEVGKIVGADAVLTGIYQISGETVRLDAKLIKVETGEVLSGSQVSGPLKDIFALEKKLAGEILAAINALATEEKEAQDGDETVDVASAEQVEGDSTDEIIENLKAKQRNKTDEEAIKDVNRWVDTVKY